LRRFNEQPKKRLDQADLGQPGKELAEAVVDVSDLAVVLGDEKVEIGFLDNAVVLITADHGEEFLDHGGLLHRSTLFEELVRVPLILWGRSVPAGVVDPALVSTVDIAPTLLAAAGIEPPKAMEGRNVLAADTTPWGDQRVFAQYGTKNDSLRTPRYKLIRGSGGRLALFDLEPDPQERRNLSRDLASLAAELDDELESWRRERPRLAEDAAATTGIDPATGERLRTLGCLD
jgi:arylsulfatase A-like enzyme